MHAAGSGLVGSMGGAPSSATSALDAFMDMSADTLAAAAAGGSSFKRSSSSSGPPGPASAAGFERYGLEHPGAAADDAADGDGDGQEGQQQQQGGSKQVRGCDGCKLSSNADAC